MINVGEFDMKDGVRQSMEWTKNIDFPERPAFDSQARSAYAYPGDDKTMQNGGLFRSAGNFTLMITPKAGHMVPFAQTGLTQKYVTDYLKYGELRCGGKACDTVAADMCDFMNNCNGHGTCSKDTGECSC